MTHTNKKRNFLAAALATASAATLILSFGNTAFAGGDGDKEPRKQTKEVQLSDTAKRALERNKNLKANKKEQQSANIKVAAVAAPVTYAANANDAAVSTAASWLPNTPGPADSDLLQFVNSGGSNGNGVIVFDADKSVMLDIKGSTLASVKVNSGKTATIGGIINSGSAGTAVTADIATDAILELYSPFLSYGGSNAVPGSYDLLSAVNFSGTGGTFSIMNNNVSLGANFTNDVGGTGTIVLAGNNIVLTGNVGAASNLANIDIFTFSDTYTTITGNIFTTAPNGIRLSSGSTVELKGNDYRLSHIHGDTVGGQEGTLKFTGGGPVNLETTGAAGNNLNTLVIDGNTALTLFGTNGLDFYHLKFTGTSGTPILTLPDQKAIASYVVKTITSTRGVNIPEVRTSGIAQVISATNTYGDVNNLVRFRMMDATAPNSYTVNAVDFYGQITTNTPGLGDVTMNAVNGKIYGLGEADKMLNSVKFNQNTTNFGNTYAKNSIISDGKTVTLGGVVAGTVQLGATIANGAVLNLTDQVSLIGNLTAYNGSTTNTVNFLGSVNQINQIGDTTTRINKVDFEGPTGSVAKLSGGTIYGTTINFNNTTIDTATGNATVSGTSNINNRINLGTNQLTLQDNQNNINSTWGANTSISPTLSNSNGTVTSGRINIKNKVDVAASSNISVIPSVGPNIPLSFSTPIISVDGGAFDLKGSSFNVSNSGSANAYALYTVQFDGSNDYNLVSSDNAAAVVSQDFAAAGITDPTDIQNSTLLVNATSGNAEIFVSNTGLITDSATRANAFQRLTNSNITQINSAVNQGLVFGSVDTITTRMSDMALQVDRNEIGQGAPGAGDDDKVVGAPMGAWLAPVYNQANQKSKGGNPGYKVKSGGGVIGLDTDANDNLVVGAAVTVLNSEMKMKDQKSGDKAKIGTFMFSLYGSQELVRDFFVQGVASFSSSKIKGKERRLVPTTVNVNGYETAYSNYNSMGFGGEVLLGYNAKPMEGVFLTPTAGVRYIKVADDSYQETGTTYQNKWVSKKASDRVDAIAGFQVETNIKRPDHTIVPEAHAYVTQKLGGKSGQVYSIISGLNTSFASRKDTSARTFYNVGFGTRVMAGAMEYGAGYDAYFASKYIAHQGSLKVRVNF